MKKYTIYFAALIVTIFCSCQNSKDNEAKSEAVTTEAKTKQLFLDVHNLEPGKVTPEDVADAHKKDLAVQDQFGVKFIKYWVDQAQGKVYCLAEASDSASVAETHKQAHGLLPDLVHSVSDGPEAALTGNQLYIDIHHLGAGNVTAEAVAGAHEKDLAVQNKHGVNFINYWVDEKTGNVVCLSEAAHPDSITNTHKEAHGLLPHEIHRVVQGQ